MEYLIGGYVGVGLFIFLLTNWESEWSKGKFDIFTSLIKLSIVGIWPAFIINYVRSHK